MGITETVYIFTLKKAVNQNYRLVKWLNFEVFCMQNNSYKKFALVQREFMAKFYIDLSLVEFFL